MISVIVPAHDAAGTLPACLAALAAQTLQPLEVIVVDDGSRDGTAALAEAAGVYVIRQDNAGPAAARNAGARLARGEILAFTDSDCIPDPDWLAELTRPLADAEVIGAKGVYRTDQRDLVPRFVQQEYQDKYDRMARRATIDFIDTYSAAYRRAVFLENGGFETAFPAPSVEDQELSFRLTAKGYRLVFAPRAVVAHNHDADLGEYARRKFWIGYWKAFLLRWHPARALGDAHTPVWQRLQLILLAAVLMALALTPLVQPAIWLALGAGLAFVGVAVPFDRKLLARDPGVFWAAQGLLVVRAAALGFGLVAGAVGLGHRARPRRAGLSGLGRVIKRAVDVFGALVGLALCLPFAPLVAWLVAREGPGPFLFRQPRVGQDGRVFTLYKVRTMTVAAPPGASPGSTQRVTAIGRVLRRWSLDELPQLWNVLRGEMSLVGPRPEEPRVVAGYSDWHRLRLAVRPGLTGPMQVNGRKRLSLDERVRLDLAYIEDASLMQDLAILLRSIPAVLSGDGAE